METSTIALIIMVISIILFATEKIPLAVVALLSMLAMAFSGCITYQEAFSGFSNTATLMIIGMSIISSAFFTTGLSKKIGNYFLGLKNLTENRFVIILIIMGLVLSGPLNGLIVMAIFMPIIDSIATETEGKITRKNTYLPLGIAAVFGGNLTCIGSTSMLNASAIIGDSYYGREMSFFEPLILGLPGCIILLAVAFIFGNKIQNRLFDFEDVYKNTNSLKEDMEGEQPVWKQWFVVIVLIGCIIAFILGFNYGAISLLGGCLVIAAGCIDIKKAMKGISWQTVLIVVGTLGFAKCVEVSGAGNVITEFMLDICGPLGESAFGMAAVMLVLSTVLSNFMSNNATVGICVPIALSLAQIFGVDAMPFVLSCAIGANLSVATPICTALITLTTVAGYRFKDYVKYGGLFNILALIATAAVLGIVYF